MAKQVLHTNDQVFASRPQLLVPTCLTYGQQDIVFAPYGSHWRQVRKVANLQLLTSSKLVHFTKIVKAEILNAIQTVLEQSRSGGKEDCNVSVVLSGMTMNIITQMMWNKSHRNASGSQSLRDQKFEELITKVLALAESNNVADFLPSSLKPFVMGVSGLDRKAKNTRKGMDEFSETIICEKEQALSKEMKAATDDDDFMNILLKFTNHPEDSQRLSRNAMKAILAEMIVAGTDTTSVTLDWIFTELLKHPDMMKKAQDELTTVVGQDRLVSELDIPNLKYLDAVVREGFRKYSALPLSIPHLSMAECKVGGYHVPANTTVFINIFAIHHDSTVWERPWEFNPDRFLHSDKDYRGRHYDFIPFGSGRRSCPGTNLASTVVHLGLAQLLHAVSWSLPEGQGPENVDTTETPGLSVTRATPLVVKAKPRLAHHVIYPAMA